MPIRVLIGIANSILILTMNQTMIAWAAPEMMGSQAIIFSKEDQKLTVHIDKVPLREVLQVLANRLPVTITLMGFEGHNRLSTTYTDLSLEQGIERLLQGQDYALLYSRADSYQQTYLKEIIVLPRQDSSTHLTSAETTIVMLPAEHHRELSEEHKQPPFNSREHRKLEPTELADKVEALVQLSDQNQAQGMSLLTQATKDQNPEIRATAAALLEQLEFSSP